MPLYRKIRKRQRKPNNRDFYEIGDVVDLDASELRNFVDQWERISPEEPDPDELPMLPNLELQARGGGWWNIVNTELGKVLNPKPLRREAAEKLLEELL